MMVMKEAQRPLVNFIDPAAVKITFGDTTTLLFNNVRGVYTIRENVIGGGQQRGKVTIY